MTSHFYIHPEAKIHPSVQIGFGCWINSNVTIEKDVTIAPYVVLGGAPQHRNFYGKKPSYGVVIKEGSRLFEFVTIHAGTINNTVIGKNTSIFTSTHISHDCVIGDNVTIGGDCSLAGHTIVMDGANVNGKTCTVPYAAIGHYSFCGAMSFITHHVPPGMRAIGYPARITEPNIIGLERAGLDISRCTDLYLEKFYELTKGRDLK